MSTGGGYAVSVVAPRGFELSGQRSPADPLQSQKVLSCEGFLVLVSLRLPAASKRILRLREKGVRLAKQDLGLTEV